jgi:hypothetical protein
MSKNKNPKKTNCLLKFELTTLNLSCFMKKKSTSKMEPVDIKKNRKKSKSKALSLKKKNTEIQEFQ